VQSGFAGTCRKVALAGSSEDIQLDRARGLAYLSLLDRDSLARGEASNGTVMLLDLNVPDPAPRAAMSFDPADFRPHGLSLLKPGSGPARLFAISHQPDGRHAVEIAEEGTSGGFFPKETLRDPAFIHPNAIAATGPRSFYLANDSTEFGRWVAVKQWLFRSGSATLVYFDGKQSRVEDSGLDYVAGLALSPDASRLYVAETLARALRIYRRDAASGALTLAEVVDLDTAPDNLNVDDEGVVWIAAHPKLLSFVGHVRDSAKRAPTQVLRFDPRKSGDARLTQVYLNSGDEISAGTVAARWHDEFLIGALLDKKVLICKLKP
jgi:arylesterase/paraoxonase